MKQWIKSGAPWVWLTAASVSLCVIMVVGLLLLIAARGLGHFWPADVLSVHYGNDDTVITIIGEIHNEEWVTTQRLRDSGLTLATDEETVQRVLLKVGNRDITGLDFRWLVEPLIIARERPPNIMVLERYEWGNFYGYLHSVSEHGVVTASGETAWGALEQRLHRATQLRERIDDIEKGRLSHINSQLEKLRLKERARRLQHNDDNATYADIDNARTELNRQYESLQQQLATLYHELSRDSLTATVMDGQTVEIPLSKLVRAYRPNTMGTMEKTGLYLSKLGEFLLDDPREANTEGGIFPAIFGTVMMVIVMSIFVTPFGVIAAIYLREYATQGPVTRTIRIAVNNLAGVPSIVYGVFGLGFFVYFLGGAMDQLFFPAALPAPTFGTPGLLWASLTLALLTVPVVIVATEEGLSRVPRAVREGSLALGATQAETLWRTVIPMASPAIMTGLILAVARAAGEVAPLMLVGVVKLAPSLPVDLEAPYVHLERKFMHLGFHIYDVGFQSPNVEAARPLVYATALLLVLVIIVLNLAAITLRNRLREKYKSLEH